MYFSSSTSRLKAIISSAVTAVLLVIFAFPADAQGNSAIAQQFQATGSSITAASLVSIQQDHPNAIELSSTAHADRVVGVVNDKPLIELSNGNNGVQVVTNGLTKLLVSDVGGAIVTGDRITSSPIEGVGMKATSNTTVVGVAQGTLDLSQAQTKTITDKTGKHVTVHIGLIPVQVAVAFYNADAGKKSTFVPTFLQSLANNVAGRDVSPVRVLIAGLIMLLLFLSITVLLYSAVRSSIISIGRNPLSESAVRKSLFQVGITVLVVLLVAAVIVYLVLKA